MVDYVADYLENIRDRRVFPDVKPGYMRDLVPESAPMDGEKWENIFNDVETVIMPGVILEFRLIKGLSIYTISVLKFIDLRHDRIVPYSF